MTIVRPLTQLIAVGAVAALGVTACGGGSNSNNSAKTSTDKGAAARTAGTPGGTLTLLNSADFEHLDPARNYVSDSLDFGRLLYRTLTTFKAVPGKGGNEIVGDLATDIGTTSDGGMTWKFTLRDGIKYEDGSAVTAADVKYGVERAFDPDLPEGPQYIQQFLADVPAGYKGPKKSGKGLDSIVASGKTITFKLKKAVGDFSYTVAEPTTAPIPQAKDTGIQYDNRVFSSGPYMIETYKRGKTLTLIRNKSWDKKTDLVRNAYPDKIVVTMGLDPATIDQRLIANSAQDETAIDFDTTLAPESIPQAEGRPDVKSRSIRGLDGYVRYLAINTTKVKNLKVRQAIQYAVNKETYRTARGGKSAGDYATTMMTPLLPGYLKFDLYPAPPQGDPTKAKQLLQEAGVTLPLRLNLATTNVGKGVTTAVAVQAALKRAGIEVNIQQISPDVYYTTIGDTAKEPELAFSSWGPDWPSGSTVMPPLFDGRQIKPQGNNNVSQLNVDAINKEMDRVNGITDIKKQAPEWGKLDKLVLEQASVVPLIYNAGIQVHGSKVKGAYLHAYYGLFDMVSMSVG